jgi:hypothetical protein
MKPSGDIPEGSVGPPCRRQRRRDGDGLLSLQGVRRQEAWGFDGPVGVILFCFAELGNLN